MMNCKECERLRPWPNLPGGTEENHEKSVRMVGVRGRDYLCNT
jgi:hypothetical protein